MILRRLFMSRLRRRVLANLDLAMSGAGYEPSRRTATPERDRFSRPVLPVSAPETGPDMSGGVALSQSVSVGAAPVLPGIGRPGPLTPARDGHQPPLNTD